LAIAVSQGGNDAETAFHNEFVIQEHLKPIYAGLRELTIPHPQPDGDDLQRSGKSKLLDRSIKNLFIGRFIHDHHVPRSYALVARYLEVSAELGMDIRKGRNTELRANTAQVEELLCTRELLDLIAQNQDMDPSENRAIRHGGAPPAIGGKGVEAEYTARRARRGAVTPAETGPSGSCRPC